MNRYLTCAAALLLALAVVYPSKAADKKYVFALVPKNTNNPFFDQARDGCKKAEKELGGAVECLYVGPGEHGGGEEQVQVVNDLIARHVDGIAVSPSNAPAMGRALARDPVRRAAMGVAARQGVVHRSWSALGNELLDNYRAVLGPAPRQVRAA